MKSENFVAFFTICGFFIGLIFSMVKFDSAETFVLTTLVITFFFYLFIHAVLILFLSAKTVEDTLFAKEKFESEANAQIAEIKVREDKITTLLKSIHGVQDTKEGVV